MNERYNNACTLVPLTLSRYSTPPTSHKVGRFHSFIRFIHSFGRAPSRTRARTGAYGTHTATRPHTDRLEDPTYPDPATNDPVRPTANYSSISYLH